MSVVSTFCHSSTLQSSGSVISVLVSNRMVSVFFPHSNVRAEVSGKNTIHLLTSILATNYCLLLMNISQFFCMRLSSRNHTLPTHEFSMSVCRVFRLAQILTVPRRKHESISAVLKILYEWAATRLSLEPVPFFGMMAKNW